MLYEKNLLEQFALADRQTASTPMFSLLQMQQQSSWEYFNVGMALLSKDMELCSYNSSFCHLTNLPPESVLKNNFYGIFSLKQAAINTVNSLLEADGRWSGKLKLGDRSLRLDITRLPQSDAGKPAYSVILIDYTEEFRQMQLLSEAKFQAEKADRAKSQFLSHMSHELRTPLNAILGFSQLLTLDETLSEMQMDNVREIESAGEYLLSLINEVLDLSRIEAGRIELHEDSIDFENLLNDCMMLVKPLAETRHVALEYRLSERCQLRNDPTRLKQILINLLSNAVKYNNNEGGVLVQCKTSDTGILRIEIIDTGNGINNELLPYIFTPFERLGAEQKHIEGTGIGLMITRRLIKLMKGDIGVISQRGAGSVFWLDLPLQFQSDGNIRSRGASCSTLFNVSPIYGFGPADSKVFRLISDLCSVRNNLTFQQDQRLELFGDWLQHQRHGHVVIHASALAKACMIENFQTLLQKFDVVVVNDTEAAAAETGKFIHKDHQIISTECKYAQLPMVHFDKTESCKVIKQCN